MENARCVAEVHVCIKLIKITSHSLISLLKQTFQSLFSDHHQCLMIKEKNMVIDKQKMPYCVLPCNGYNIFYL